MPAHRYLDGSMRAHRYLVWLLLLSATTLLLPSSAVAGPELTFVLGAMIGDSFTDVLRVRPDGLIEGFKDAPIFGGRLGWSAFPFAVEGSLVYSPSAVTIADAGNLDANLVYAEAEVQIIILPGPIAPFVGGGIGIHSMQLRSIDVPRETTIGYVFGGGVKAAFGSLGLRVDLRDHITPLDVGAAGEEFLRILRITENTKIHNVELSGGLTIRF